MRDKSLFKPLGVFTWVGTALLGCFPALAANTIQPTSVTVTNSSPNAVYLNLVLGQPPVSSPWMGLAFQGQGTEES